MFLLGHVYVGKGWAGEEDDFRLFGVHGLGVWWTSIG